MAFPARDPGRCVVCGERFDEGDRITVSDGGTVCAVGSPTPKERATDD